MLNLWYITSVPPANEQTQTRMWADAQRDGRPAEYRWRPVLNAAKRGHARKHRTLKFLRVCLCGQLRTAVTFASFRGK